MSWWSRAVNVFRGDRVSREIDNELQSHFDEAIESGRDPVEVRRMFGSALRHREASLDVRVLPWLDSIRADCVFGWRQLRRRPVTSMVAILSLALALGACTSAFRLIDGLLLRPLPVVGAARLWIVAQQGVDPGGHFRIGDSFEYPLFARMRAALRGEAELIAISYSDRTDLTFGSDDEMEKADRQYVSGWMFEAFGLRPAVGRLFTASDDDVPRAHPYAVLSYDYWTGRFARDPAVVGRSFRMGNDVYQIIGVGPRGFTGTEPGVSIDVFIPTMMKPSVTHSNASWIRIYVRPGPDAAPSALRDHLEAVFEKFEQEQIGSLASFPASAKRAFLSQRLLLRPAASGISSLQRAYGQALVVLGALVAFVLFIACANVANLLVGQTAARAREMALRVSLGAGRRRLVQLVLIESAILACVATAIGAVFAWWSAPFVMHRISPASDPVRLVLPLDWRLSAFTLALPVAAACAFGLLPAVRASMVTPMTALKSGPNPPVRRHLMRALIAMQVGFCVLVLFVGGLFLTTVRRLTNRPTGFSTERLLAVDVAARVPEPPALWNQVLERLRQTAGVEAVALAGFPLLSGQSWNGFIAINGVPAGSTLAFFLGVSPGWIGAMKIPLLAGRDLSADDGRQVAIVNQAFARTYFDGRNPIGASFEKTQGDGKRTRFQIIGLTDDALYQNLREPVTPTAYVPFSAMSISGAQRAATFVVRSARGNPLALASQLRQEVPQARPEFRVSSIRTQAEIDASQMLRERLLGTPATFFAGVAVLLTTIGLYGALHYAVVQRRREIGIRRAIGAGAGDIARRMIAEVGVALPTGVVAGLALGATSVHYVRALLYGARATDPSIVLTAGVTMFTASILAAVPPIIRAARINPIETLRAE